MQVKLLRFIQEGEIERVGAALPTKLDVRIIAATNRNLPFLVKKGKFREDLYHRLNVITLQLPNLRDRAEDIPELVQYFFRRSCAKHQRDDLRLSLPVLNRFAEYPWPGNIRELENAIERIVVLTPGREVALVDLPSGFQSEAAPLERIGLINCSASKRTPFFQTSKVMAAILRAKVSRTIAGFMPTAMRAS